MSLVELNNKYKVGTIIKVKSWPIPRNSDDVTVIDYVKSKYGDSPLSYVTAYAGDSHVYLSHVSSKPGKSHKLKFNIKLLDIVDSSKIQDPTNYLVNYSSKKAPLTTGDIINIDNNDYVLHDPYSFNSTTGTGKVKVILKDLTSPDLQYGEILTILLTETNWYRVTQIAYNRGTFNTICYIKDQYKEAVKTLYRTKIGVTDDCDLNYIVNLSFNVSRTYTNNLISISDSWVGKEIIISNDYIIDLYTLLGLTSSTPIPLERKFSKLKCLKNKGKTQYKLTIGKDYPVIKYQIDELIGSERVIILNDNNVEKSYDPKLFKGIE